MNASPITPAGAAPLAAIVAQLDGVKRTRDGYTARCPAHDDRKASLCISEHDGRVLLHCHAGCSVNDICAALGIDIAALFAVKPQQAGKPRIVARYEYTDACGNGLYSKERDERKNFWFYRTADGKKEYGLGGSKHVLYHLPLVVAAAKAGETIFIVEGEKDADNLYRLGFFSTTDDAGASRDGERQKWRAEYNSHFQGAAVVILPDKDEPGRARGRHIAAQLKAVARSVKIVELPGETVKDVSDWIAAGGGEAALLAIVAAAPFYHEQRVKLVCLKDIPPEPVVYFWEPRIISGKLNLIEGMPGAGKTHLALQMASAASRGWGLPDRSGQMPPGVREARNVLYLSCEDGIGDTIRPRLDRTDADLSRIFVLQGVSIADIAVLHETMARLRPALTVIDPIQGFLPAGTDMNKAEAIRPLLAELARLAELHGCAVILIRHLTKAGKDQAISRGLGSIDFAAAARSMLLVGEDPEDKTRRCVVHTKNNLAPRAPTLTFTLEDGAFYWRGVSEVTAADVLQPEREIEKKRSAIGEAEQFLTMLLMDGPKTYPEIEKQAKAEKISHMTLKRAKLMKNIASVKGKGGLWYWSLPEDRLKIPGTEKNEPLESDGLK